MLITSVMSISFNNHLHNLIFPILCQRQSSLIIRLPQFIKKKNLLSVFNRKMQNQPTEQEGGGARWRYPGPRGIHHEFRGVEDDFNRGSA
jgi:hypothetical protein